MREFPLNKFRFAGQSERQKYFIVALYFFILSLVVRFPFFFNSSYNWDEGTFILMGQSIVDGQFPYIDLWEIKPPLTFLAYASFIVFFGKTIASIRLGGAICVAVTSLFIYKIGKTLWNSWTGILGGTLFIFSATLIESGKATMTEHIAVVPLMGALSLLVAPEITFVTVFEAGVLMGIASLIRLNLAYVALFAGFFVLFIKPRKPIELIWKRGLAYSAGNLLVVFLSYFPYLVTGNHKVWWDSVIVASLRYSQLSMLEVWLNQINYISRSIAVLNIRPITGISILVWLGGLAGLILLSIQWKNASAQKRNGFAFLLIFILATEISILKGGGGFSHYLIQVAPLLSLTAAALIGFLFFSPVRWLAIFIVLWSFGMAIIPSFKGYKFIVSRWLSGQTIKSGVAYEIADYLTQENTLKDPVYLMTDHVVYWLVNAKPMTKYIHPSNISRDFFLELIVGSESSTDKEMARILAQKPKFIVKQESVWYLSSKKNALLLLEKTLREEYKLVQTIQGRQIYRRI